MSESDSGISKNAPALNAGIKSDKIPVLQIISLFWLIEEYIQYWIQVKLVNLLKFYQRRTIYRILGCGRETDMKVVWQVVVVGIRLHFAKQSSSPSKYGASLHFWRLLNHFIY